MCKDRGRIAMKPAHAGHIFSDIGYMVQEIKTYFNDLDSENIGSEMYAERIAKELGARIENINGVIQTTLLTYLDKDARQAISDWEPVDQNRYYDKKIRDQVSSRIDETASFSPKIFPKKYIQIASGVVAAGGLYRAVVATAFPSGAFIVVVAAGMFFLIPRVVDKHNKTKTLEQLNAHLDAVETRYQEQARKIIEEYVALFEEITPAEEN